MNEGYQILKDAIYYCEDKSFALAYKDSEESSIYGEAAWRMRQILSQYWDYFRSN